MDAGEAFLATLSEEQRATAQVELSPRLAVRWTNFPGGSNVRNGVFFRDLNPEQVDAALKVARIALGEEGFARYQEVRAADDVFAKGHGGPDLGDVDLAVLTRRNRRSHQEGRRRWRGHVRGEELHDRVPGQALEDHAMDSAIGWPPSRHQYLLQRDDRRCDPLSCRGAADSLEGRSGQDARTARPDARVPARLALSLTPEQSKQAKLDSRFNDVYVGPGKDGKFPTKSEGVPVFELSDASKDFVKKAIAAWTGDSPQGTEFASSTRPSSIKRRCPTPARRISAIEATTPH